MEKNYISIYWLCMYEFSKDLEACNSDKVIGKEGDPFEFQQA